jgi:hypothetical protein
MGLLTLRTENVDSAQLDDVAFGVIHTSMESAARAKS